MAQHAGSRVRPDRTAHAAGSQDKGPARIVAGAPPAPPATALSPMKEPDSSPLDAQTEAPPVACRPEDQRDHAVRLSPQKRTSDGEFQPLFNGKDLTGWVPRTETAGQLAGRDGILTGSGPAISRL